MTFWLKIVKTNMHLGKIFMDLSHVSNSLDAEIASEFWDRFEKFRP